MPRQDFKVGENFDEELFTDIWEKRLACLLSNEVINTEQKWFHYFFEESQVKIDITDMILEDMIHEICIITNSIEDNDKPGDESIFRNLPEELVELNESWKVDPNKPMENTLFT